MAAVNISGLSPLVDIQTSLNINRQLKHSLVRVTHEFMDVRDAFLRQLPTFVIDTERRVEFVERFHRITQENIQQQEIPLGLIVFGPNSSGKSSFIQHFLKIGDILPWGIGSVTARIVRLTYAPADQARALIHDSLANSFISNKKPTEIDLKSYFLTPQPQWIEISNVLGKYLNRAENNNVDLAIWAKSFVEIFLPSPTLQMGIDVYDTPGFLSLNRENTLMENLYELAKTVRPTLLFLYENSSIAETEMNCFLAMKEAIGSLDRVPIFFLNTKADVALILKDSGVHQQRISIARFKQILDGTRQERYDLLRKQAVMANELLGGLPTKVDECQCFDICTVPKGRTPWRELADHMNNETFSRIIAFATQVSSEYADELANEILSRTDDFFDLAVSASYRQNQQFLKLRDDAIEWGASFFAQFKIDLPKLVEHLHGTIVRLFDESKSSIANRAARRMRDNDPIMMLLHVNSKSVRDFIRVAVEEQIMKVAVNETINTMRSQIKSTMEIHFDHRIGRKNELLKIAQRTVLPEISPTILTKQTVLSKFIEGLIKLPMRISRFFRSLPTLPYIDYYNNAAHNQMTNEEDPTYKLLDCLDMYANLSDESKRLAFAEQYLNVLLKEVLQRKQSFHNNLHDWMEQQRKAFNASIQTNYSYVISHLHGQQILHDIITQYYSKFAKIECEVLAAKHLTEFNGISPTIKNDEMLGKGGYFSIHPAEWGDEKSLVVKKLIRQVPSNPYMAYLDAHYQRVVSSLKIKKIVHLTYLFENRLDNGEYELWIILPRYTRSLRDYLVENIRNITVDMVLRFAIDIAETLTELHRYEVVHRDIKASNILLDQDHQCYLTDFGTAKIGMANDTIVGTAPLPPEMIWALCKQHETVFTYDGAAADIYSFGLLLYEMHPKDSYHRIHPQSFEDIKRLLQNHDVRSASGLAAFAKLIESCVQAKPVARPSAKNVLDRLWMIKKSFVDHEFIEIKECIVCFNQERQIRFQPCGHKVVCETCWQELCTRNEGHSCIYCRGLIEQHINDNEHDETLLLPL